MPQIKNFENDAALSRAAASDWLALLRDKPGPHLAALSGGSIAKTFFATVAEMAKRSGVSMNNVEFFWADERCVPPGDSESNFRIADENLFNPLRIAPEKIHRLKGELPPPVAVAEAIADLRHIAPKDSGGIPILDVIFLGIGPDGHTASLMPNATPATLQSREPYVHVDNSPKPPPNRITMTYPVLAAAREVWTLITGQGKTEPLRESLRPGGTTPFARVLQSRSETRIYSDVPS
ncbi:MAG TPA: 6-phosphogluconolactonase [Verrucomicrobiae bacterium]|jgi:6-phosphogluconolactonase